jgi:hypothetical protein
MDNTQAEIEEESNAKTAKENIEKKEYKNLYIIITIISICALTVGIFCIVDSFLLNAYRMRHNGIIIFSLGMVSFAYAFGYKELYNKIYKYPIKRQLAEAQHKIIELERQLEAKIHELPYANTEITLIAWEKALEGYQPSRKNDSLPERMRVLFRYLRGEKFSSIEQSLPGTNVSVYLKKAREEDAPKLKKQFPNLPDLNL